MSSKFWSSEEQFSKFAYSAAIVGRMLPVNNGPAKDAYSHFKHWSGTFESRRAHD